MNESLAVAGLTLALFVAPVAHGRNVTVSEQEQIMKTYSFFDPDATPNIGTIYPYFVYRGYSRTATKTAWSTVTLENPYLKLLVTPRIGGKVWRAVEKSTGRDFLYYNKVVKFRDIGLRGPWTSGGLEFNFGPYGHAPTCSTPVDYALIEDEDGSVACVVGCTDLSSRTRWWVVIRLPVDKAYFETETFWYNPTVLRQSSFHWMNAAFDASDDLSFCFRGTHHIDHGGAVFPWPIDKHDRDLSLYRNNDFGSNKSYHIVGEYTDWWGGYWESRGFGFGHIVPYVDKCGQKLWIWALSRQGGMWEDLLTDKGNTQYTEIQTGLLFNQAAQASSQTPFKHVWFPPLSDFRFTETWFPIKDIGGMVSANRFAVLNVTMKPGAAEIGICPLKQLNDELVVLANGNELYRKRLTLQPMQTSRDTIGLGQATNVNLTVLIGDKMRYSSADTDKNKLQRPIKAPDGFDWESADGLRVAGEELARQQDYEGAMAKLEGSLKLDPFDIRTLASLAEIFCRRAEYDKALDYSKSALALNAYDADANFIYGVANRRSGNMADAKDGFGRAALSMAYRSAAYSELAKIHLEHDDIGNTLCYANHALDYNRFGIVNYHLLAIAYRMQGDTENARRVLRRLLELDPLSHFARFEEYCLAPEREKLDEFKSMIRSEFPEQTYLELAIAYADVGREKDAVTVLAAAPPYPVVSYWLAYLLRESDPGRSAELLNTAAGFSPYLVFPFRTETMPVLKWAIDKNDSWKSRYYLGLIYWNKGRLEEAAELFNVCKDEPEFAPFYIARARLLDKKDNADAAVKEFKKAVAHDPDDWKAAHAMINAYLDNGHYEDALAFGQKAAKKFPDNWEIQMDYAKALVCMGNAGDCLSVLSAVQVLPDESFQHGLERRVILRQANLMEAVKFMKAGDSTSALAFIDRARAWPENLGMGKPYFHKVYEQLEDYMAGLCTAETEGSAKMDELLNNFDKQVKKPEQWSRFKELIK